ncbi:hypothetical protein Tco_0301605, partial [Tanacetum coccineum]
RQSNLPTFGRQGIPKTNRQELRGICGRSGDQKLHGTRNNKGHRRNVQDPKKNKHEAKPQEMHLWNGRMYVLGIQGKHQRDKGMSGQGGSHPKPTVPQNV